MNPSEDREDKVKMKGAGRTKKISWKKMIKDDGKKKGKKIERKKTIVTTAKAKNQQKKNQDEPPHRRSKCRGVNWHKQAKGWEAKIRDGGKVKKLGRYRAAPGIAAKKSAPKRKPTAGAVRSAWRPPNTLPPFSL